MYSNTKCIVKAWKYMEVARILWRINGKEIPEVRCIVSDYILPAPQWLTPNALSFFTAEIWILMRRSAYDILKCHELAGTPRVGRFHVHSANSDHISITHRNAISGASSIKYGKITDNRGHPEVLRFRPRAASARYNPSGTNAPHSVSNL